jgi:hypothetical protein
MTSIFLFVSTFDVAGKAVYFAAGNNEMTPSCPALTAPRSLACSFVAMLYCYAIRAALTERNVTIAFVVNITRTLYYNVGSRFHLRSTQKDEILINPPYGSDDIDQCLDAYTTVGVSTGCLYLSTLLPCYHG